MLENFDGARMLVKGVCVGFAVAGCANPERDIRLDGREPDKPIITWNRGNAHEVEVVWCEDECRCESGQLETSSDDWDVVWSVGYRRDRSLGDVAASDPPIASPLAYGADVPGDERHIPAVPLEPGEVYGIVVVRFSPCETTPDSVGMDQCARPDDSCLVYQVPR